MKIFKELTIILLISLLASIVVSLFNLPLSISVVGILILLVLLLTKVIKESQIQTTSDFLSEHLLFFYIPSAVAIIDEFHYVSSNIAPFIFMCFLCTILIMIATSVTAQLFEDIVSKNKNNK